MEQIRDIASRLRNLPGRLTYLPGALGLVWSAARAWTIAWVVPLALQGLLPAATAALTKLLVDSLVPVVGSGGSWETIRPAALLALLMGLVLLLGEVLGSISNWIRAAQSDLVRDHVTSLLQKHSLALDLSFFDSADYYDHLHRARAEASFRPVSLLQNLGELLQSVITMLAMAALLVPYGAWLPVALVVSTIPAFYVTTSYNLREHRWRRRRTADERRAWYYDWLLTARETAAELRLFGLGDHYRSLYRTLRREIRGERLALGRDRMLARLGASLVALLVTAAVAVWIGRRVWLGSAALGDLALFYQVFSQGQRLMRSLLESVGQVYSNSFFLANLFEFLDLNPEVVDPVDPVPAPSTLEHGIRFNEVAFHYPGEEREVLRELSLEIPAGSIAAIVGANGAGKSTLVKLLCRFYDPESGDILLDGTRLRDLRLVELRRLVTVLFQEPVRYHTTAAENIALGDLASGADTSEIEMAAQASAADQLIRRLPQGYETQLGKWFEGSTDLSFGEWQRIALARAFLRQAPIIVLDEPTSAMDSWTEVDWLQRFRRLASGRTGLIITHRFTTAMYADIIHVMDEGQIVESGSHHQLLALGGRYAQSWRAQMRAATGGDGEAAATSSPGTPESV